MMNSKDKVLRQLKTAKHLLNITFPLVKDPKLLIGIIHNLNSCLNYALEVVFLQESAMPKSLNEKIDLLHRKYDAKQEHTELIRKINHLVALHKESPIVFKRGNRQIICDENYHIEVISAKEIENLIDKTEEFLSHIGVIS